MHSQFHLDAAAPPLSRVDKQFCGSISRQTNNPGVSRLGVKKQEDGSLIPWEAASAPAAAAAFATVLVVEERVRKTVEDEEA